MVITIASGKGGTGKTTLAVNLARVLAKRGEKIRLLDCDVEEPNDHLFLDPEFVEDTPVVVPKPVWNPEACSACGKCVDACNYNAIALVKNKVLIFNELCHSCGVCSHICPENALTETDTAIGSTNATSQEESLFFAHGMLNIGEALAPDVVRAVKKYIDPSAVNIIDASPGTACPVVEAVRDADAVLLVTEPTPFGLNDLKLAVGLTLKVGVPTGIVVNRSDGVDAIIAEYAEEIGLPITGRIPFAREYATAYSKGDIIADHFPEFRDSIIEVYENLRTARPNPPPDVAFDVDGRSEPAISAGGTSNAERFVEVGIISGKGGTGKTTIAAAFAELSRDKILTDNDVDAADLHLLLDPKIHESHEFVGGITARIDPDACNGCGECARACHFSAIRVDEAASRNGDTKYRVEPLLCEGCGLCPIVCPVDAVRTQRNINGHWYVSSTEFGPLVHARLGIAEENSGRLVTAVRNRAAELARIHKLPLILSDGPPGTGCPVIASVSGCDLLVIVTEPTVSGVHDLERVLMLAGHFSVTAAVIINKADLNERQADLVETTAERYHSPVIGRIPFEREVNDALMRGKTITAYGKGRAVDAVREAWNRLAGMIDEISSTTIPEKSKAKGAGI